MAVGVVSNGDERGSRRAMPQAEIGGEAISDHGRGRTHVLVIFIDLKF